MRRPLVVANWKMNGSKAKIASLLNQFIQRLDAEPLDVVVLPAALYVSQVADTLAKTDLGYGAQNVHAESQGAYTGEWSLPMLADFGCRYVLVGHSERRQYDGETDAEVAKKTSAILNAGMIPIVCVGETLKQRQEEQTQAVIEQQLQPLLAVQKPENLCRLVIAYEPVWAIGTGESASAEQAQQAHAHIRALLAKRSEVAARQCRLLYGGSVKAATAKTLFQQPDVDGGLIGGASLDAAEFIAICQAATEAKH